MGGSVSDVAATRVSGGGVERADGAEEGNKEDGSHG